MRRAIVLLSLAFLACDPTAVSDVVDDPGGGGSAGAARTTPLFSWYSHGRGDNFASTSWFGVEGDRRDPDYRFVRVEGRVFHPDDPAPEGTVALYAWYSPERGDNFLTTDPGWAGAPGDERDGYRFVKHEGWIYAAPRAGTVPLQSHWSRSRADNLATTAPHWLGEIGQVRDPDYRLYRTEGYLLPHDRLSASEERAIGFGSMNAAGQPALGARPVLTVLLEFTDVRFRDGHDATYYADLLYGAEGSVRRYVETHSRGNFSLIDAGVLGPFRTQDDPDTVADETLYNCSGDRRGAGNAQMCPGARPWETAFLRALDAADAAGYDFKQHDADNDGRVTSAELMFMLVGAEPATSSFVHPQIFPQGGAHRGLPGGCHRVGAGARAVDVCTGGVSVGEDVGYSTVAHELLHTAGTADLYGVNSLSFRLTLMAATITGVPADPRFFALDPWHLWRLGWAAPVPRPISRFIPGERRTLFPSGSGLDRSYLIYDPARGINEAFLVEYRNPNAGRYDDGSLEGVVVWRVDTLPEGHHFPRVGRISRGADGVLQTVPAPGSDDVLIRDGAGQPLLIQYGADGIMQTTPAGDDAVANDASIFVLGGPNGVRGLPRPLTAADGEVTLRWFDGTDSGMRLRVGEDAPFGALPGVEVEWRHVTQAVPAE